MKTHEDDESVEEEEDEDEMNQDGVAAIDSDDDDDADLLQWETIDRHEPIASYKRTPSSLYQIVAFDESEFRIYDIRSWAFNWDNKRQADLNN